MDDELPLRRDPALTRHGAASHLASESLDSYSQDELGVRIALLEAEIARVRAHRDRAAAHRAAAEAFFRPPTETTGS
ncbi:DUF1192 family protein [Novosphingobium piscinae]|uniref:DUF1192 family protein n=1 Tax=Novosphingobium piscinae TaxID=1507448 RepID=A0A7X1KRL3_9SPHN|nr:DUF1192 family protein [Novosphingobium piscinae]